MRLAVIPARGGSKRIPRKNILPFHGKPIIAWSIRAAIDSGLFDHVVVSTDDAEIATVALEHGAEVPFTRPKELSDDHCPTTPVVAHAIQWYMQHDRAPATVCCLYATAPFVQPSDLQRGFALLQSTGCDYAFTVTRYPYPIQRAFRITPAGRVEMMQPGHWDSRSQDLEEAWHDAGQFYWGTASAWVEGRPIFSPASVPIELPAQRVQDIDTAEDWEHAERLFLLSRHT